MEGPVSRFVPLAAHSHYSFMRGTASPEELIAAAARRGFDRLAVTDTDGVYGMIRFWEVARAAGIRPLLGAEIRGADGDAFCLVKSDAGYSRLCRLLTRRHQEPALRLAEALAEREGLVVLCASLPLLRALLEKGGRRDLYLALTAGGGTGSLARLQEARALGLPPAAAGEIYFTDPGDWEMHRLLRAIALNTTRDRVPPQELASKEAWLRSPEEIKRIFSFCPEAVENAGRIARECERQKPP